MSRAARPADTGRAARPALPRRGEFIPVSGGWHDAGDYLQHETTSANATFVMFLAHRDRPPAFTDLDMPFIWCFENLLYIRLTAPDRYELFFTGFIVYHHDFGDDSTNEPTMGGTANPARRLPNPPRPCPIPLLPLTNTSPEQTTTARRLHGGNRATSDGPVR